MRQPTNLTSSLLAVKTTVSLARGATKRIAETQDSEAADTRVVSVGVMKSRPGEFRHKLWTTAEILLVAMTGEAAMTVTEGMVDAIDVLEEKMNTLGARCQTCKARLAAAVQSKASLHLHRRRPARHLHKTGSVAHHAATTNPLTTDVVAVLVAAAISEAQGVKTTATEAVGPAVRMILCSRKERTGGNAGTRMLRQQISTRRGDAAGGN